MHDMIWYEMEYILNNHLLAVGINSISSTFEEIKCQENKLFIL